MWVISYLKFTTVHSAKKNINYGPSTHIGATNPSGTAEPSLVRLILPFV